MRNNSLQYIIGGFLCLAFLISSFPARAGETGTENRAAITYAGDRITIAAKDAPLRELLAELASTASITIYLADEVEPRRVSCQIAGASMEEALRVLLAEYNYLASFDGKGGKSSITALKIYPKGKQSGALSLVSSSNTAGSDGMPSADLATSGKNAAPGGPVLPSDPPVPPTDSPGETIEDPLFAMQQSFQEEQDAVFQEQLQIKRLMDATDDPERKQALAMAHAEQAAKLKELQNQQTNKIEAMKRLQALETGGREH